MRLSDKDIRKNKLGFDEQYYSVVENLDSLVEKVLEKLDINPIKTSRLGGESNVNVLVEAIDNKFVISISPWKGELSNRHHFYKILTDNEIPVPNEILYDVSLSVIPFEFQVTEFVESDILQTQDLKTSGHEYAEVLRKIHSIKVQNPGSDWVTSLKENYLETDYLSIQREIFTDEEVENYRSIFDDPVLNIKIYYVIHSDPGIGNVLFERTPDVKVAAILDPGPIIYGDPLFDIALLLNDSSEFSQATAYALQPGKLSESEDKRLLLYRLISYYWSACYFYKTNGDFQNCKPEAKKLLSEFAKKL